MKMDDLHRKIDLYFESLLSVEEEEALFRELVSLNDSDREAEEALAVMLMARTHRPRRKTAVGKRHLIYAAAVAVVLVGVGISVFRAFSDRGSGMGENDGMVAYVGGVKVSDRVEIMKIVDEQLNDIGESSELFAQTVAAELDDIRDAFNEDGI